MSAARQLRFSRYASAKHPGDVLPESRLLDASGVFAELKTRSHLPKARLPCWNLAPGRTADTALHVSALVGDLDGLRAGTLDDIHALLTSMNVTHFIYTTSRNGVALGEEEAEEERKKGAKKRKALADAGLGEWVGPERFRVLVLPSRDLLGAELATLWEGLANLLGIPLACIDRASWEASRLYYWPGATATFLEHAGQPIDPALLVAATPEAAAADEDGETRTLAGAKKAETSADFAEALRRFQKDHPHDWPKKTRGKCDCGSPDGMHVHPKNENRAVCFSSDHEASGIGRRSEKNGTVVWTFDVLDTELHKRGRSTTKGERGVLLRELGYLVDRALALPGSAGGEEDGDLIRPLNIAALKGAARSVERINAWMSGRGYDFSYRDQSFTCRGRMVGGDEVLAAIVLDLRIIKEGERFIKHGLSLWRAEQERMVVEMVRKRVGWNGAPDAELRRYVKACTGREDEIDVAALKHFIWQVKHKLNGRPVTRHLMPIFQGKSNSGKSTAVRRLLEPVHDVSTGEGLDLSILADDRNNFRLSRSFVILFDEMARADKVSSDSLKSKITAPTVDWRQLGSNTAVSKPNVATFIGTSNPAVVDILVDPHSSRRFYEFRCADLLDWETVNGIDPLAIWQCVNEDAPSPIDAHLPGLQKHWEEIRARSITEEFVEEQLVPTEDAKEALGRGKLYSHYANWLEAQGASYARRQLSEKHFLEEFKRLVGEGAGKGWRKSHGTMKAFYRQRSEGAGALAEGGSDGTAGA